MRENHVVQPLERVPHDQGIPEGQLQVLGERPLPMELLEELDVAKRLEEISVALASQLEVLELSHKIQDKVRDSVDKNQREYFLQEQLKARGEERARIGKLGSPASFLGPTASIKEKRCFVIMPYSMSWSKSVERIVEGVCKEVGLTFSIAKTDLYC